MCGGNTCQFQGSKISLLLLVWNLKSGKHAAAIEHSVAWDMVALLARRQTPLSELRYSRCATPVILS